MHRTTTLSRPLNHRPVAHNKSKTNNQSLQETTSTWSAGCFNSFETLYCRSLLSVSIFRYRSFHTLLKAERFLGHHRIFERGWTLDRHINSVRFPKDRYPSAYTSKLQFPEFQGRFSPFERISSTPILYGKFTLPNRGFELAYRSPRACDVPHSSAI